jgi:hypothetical protein
MVLIKAFGQFVGHEVNGFMLLYVDRNLFV